MWLDVVRIISVRRAREVKAESLDAEAGRLGVTRQSVIKVWIAERLAALRLVAQK
jgi:hypothetical protein